MNEWDDRDPRDSEESEGQGGRTDDQGEDRKEEHGSGYYNSYEYAYQTVMRNGRPKTLGWSIASLISGIISVVCCCLGWIGFAGIAAIVFAIIARRQLGYFDGMSIAGLILGIFGIVFGSAMIILTFMENADFWQSVEDAFNQGGGLLPEGGGEVPDGGGITDPGINDGF